MTADRQLSLSAGLLRTAVTATGICLAVAGCGPLQSSVRPLPLTGGFDSDNRALRKAVEADSSIPKASEVGL